ncbi:HAD family hydrolase [Azospirillum cavernae]|uniref:HAD family hydrolase n=1 Tax=Azospirillum cavernae TaxID=2320860 RepID=UPI0018F35751|nr:HAD family phosphatase [Azospirillum cavernae]
MAIRALLFDLDGTLADTDPLHFEAFVAALEPHGIAIDHQFFKTAISGRSNEAICRDLFPNASSAEHDRFADDKEAAFRRASGGLTAIDGLHALLERARGLGARIGLVTNAPAANVRHVLDLLKLTGVFDPLVLGEELPRSKPDPLPYQTALAALGMQPGEALVFEDSLPGVQAAKAAGILTVGLTTTLSADALRQAGADATVADFLDPILPLLLTRGADALTLR